MLKVTKNVATDAQASCEAMSRPNMRFVSLKTVRQQGVQAAHEQRYFLKWRTKFGGMDASLMTRMKELEDEN
jgi:hypothetical protein